MYNPFSLKGKTVLITGASSGIGEATAIECSKLGATVIITGRNEDRLRKTYEKLLGNGHLYFLADLTIEKQVVEMAKNLPEINGLVNVAGILKTLPFQFVNRLDLTDIFNINFFAPVLLSQNLIKSKKLIKGSSIVFISSIDGPLTAHIGNSMYSASKGAVTAMVKNMALDLASKKIRVNCILPGMIETPLININGITEDQLTADMNLYPLKRFGKPEEIAYAVIYLLSDASNWVTGSNLLIDGGFTLS
jgi:NAD(P)-dependent dehydrogenase (short-subunit alcohol dehydrogenase family)